MKKILCFAMAAILFISTLCLPTSAVTRYTEGQVLFCEDFSDTSKFENLSSFWTKGQTGYSLLGAYTSSNDLSSCTVENGVLNATYPSKRASRFAARILMYDIPDDVKKFSVTLDLSINSFSTDLEEKTAGTGLIVADSCSDSTATSGNDAAFSMVWLRNTLSGMYTYAASGKSGGDEATKAPLAAYAAGNSYNIYVHVDTEKAENSYFTVTEKTSGKIIVEDHFVYNTNSLETIVGIYINQGDYSYGKLSVYYGEYDPYDSSVETKYTRTNVSLGTNVALNYYTAIHPTDKGNAVPVTKFTIGTKTIEVAGTATAEENEWKFVCPIPTQCMGTNVKAELYCDETLCATQEQYSIEKYCDALLADSNTQTKVAILTADLLAYGAASQIYKDYDVDNLVSGGTPSTFTEISDPGTKSLVTNTTSDVKFKAVGVYFDAANKLYYTFNAPNGVDNVKVTIDGVEKTKDDFILVSGTTYKVYSDDIYATELIGNGTAITAVLNNGTADVQTLTYSVADYVYSMQNKETAIAGLVKALYNYAVSANVYSA